MWDDVQPFVDKILLAEALEHHLKVTLSEMEYEIVKMRIYEGFTLEECGNVIGVSKERIRQSESKALRKLRRESNDEFYEKIGVPNFDGIKAKRAKEEAERQAREEKEHREYQVWYRELRKKEVEEANRLRAREEEKRRLYQEELKAIKIPIEETRVSYGIVAPQLPPKFIQLKYSSLGRPFLECDWRYGTIMRDRDPETYDRWMEYLISKDTQEQVCPK